MPFHVKNNDIPLYRLLVLEPYDMTWMGIRQMIHATMGNRVSLIRLRDTDRLAAEARHHQVDGVLLGAVPHHIDILPLLHQLSLMFHHEQICHIAAYLENPVPHLENLLLAFGVDRVFRGTLDANDLTRCLMPTINDYQGVTLTAQERCVAQALLTGKSVTRVAQLMHRDVRTISAHKHSLLCKLGMAGRGELQVLGGRLMAADISA